MHKRLGHLACENIGLLALTKLWQECQLPKNHASETQWELTCLGALNHIDNALKAIQVAKYVG